MTHIRKGTATRLGLRKPQFWIVAPSGAWLLPGITTEQAGKVLQRNAGILRKALELRPWHTP